MESTPFQRLLALGRSLVSLTGEGRNLKRFVTMTLDEEERGSTGELWWFGKRKKSLHEGVVSQAVGYDPCEELLEPEITRKSESACEALAGPPA